MLNKIFIHNFVKNPLQFRHLKPKESITKGERENKYEMRMLTNLANKYKLKKDYLDKLVTLLHSSKSDKNYTVKRNNIYNVINNHKSNNSPYLTINNFHRGNKKNSRIESITSGTYLTTYNFKYNFKKKSLIRQNKSNENHFVNRKNINFSYRKNISNTSNFTNNTINENSEISLIEKTRQLLNDNKNELPLKEQEKIYNEMEKKINNKEKLFYNKDLPYIKSRNKNLFEERNKAIKSNYSNHFIYDKSLYKNPELISIYQRAETWAQISKKKNISKNLFKINNKKIAKNENNLDKKFMTGKFICQNNQKFETIKTETDKLVTKSKEVDEYVQKIIVEMDKYLKRKPSNDKNSSFSSIESIFRQNKNKKKESKFLEDKEKIIT